MMDWFRVFYDADDPAGGGGGDPPSDPPADDPAPWHDGHELSDEDVGYIQNKGWDHPSKMLKSYQELEKFKGADETQLLKIPSAEDAEAWKALYGRLGRPDEAKGYELDGGEGVSDPKLMEAFGAKAIELGLNVSQAKGLNDMWNEYAKATTEQAQKDTELKSETELADLRKEWGEQGYNDRVEMSKRTYREFGFDPESSTKLEEIVGAAGLIRIMSNICEKMLGDKAVTPDADSAQSFGTTIEQVKANIQSLQAELVGDPQRLAMYNQAKGADYERMEAFHERLSKEAEPIRR